MWLGPERTSMAGYEVICVVLDYDAPHEDCRCIDELGFRTPDGSTATRSPEQVWAMIEQDDDTVVVEYRGEQSELVAVEDGGQRYVRTAPEDTPEDPLLKKQPC